MIYYIGYRRLPVEMDPEDYENYKHMVLSVTSHGYVSTNVYIGKINGKYKWKREYLHRHIMKPPKGFFVDHINRNKLDNRRSNLRVVDPKTSTFNTGPKRGKYKGVYFSKKAKKWVAQCNHEHLGVFKTPEEAAEAYNLGARRLHGEFAYQNPL